MTKIIELFNSQEALSKLIKIELPIKTSYNLRKFIIEVENKLKAFSQTRDELIKKYGEEKEGQIRVKDENIQIFISEINEIGEEEVEITIPELTIDDLGESKIDTSTLIQLSYLIK